MECKRARLPKYNQIGRDSLSRGKGKTCLLEGRHDEPLAHRGRRAFPLLGNASAASSEKCVLTTMRCKCQSTHKMAELHAHHQHKKQQSDGNQEVDCCRKSGLFWKATCGQYACNERFLQSLGSRNCHVAYCKRERRCLVALCTCKEKKIGKQSILLPWVMCTRTRPHTFTML